jgi:replicative DNA helicase
VVKARNAKGLALRQFVPPQNLEAEKAVLGAILSSPDAMDRVVDILSPSDFYKDAHSKIYEIMLELYERNEVTDILTVSTRIRERGLSEKVGGAAYLNELVDFMPSSANIGHYAKMVKEKALLRRMIEVAEGIIEKSHDPEIKVEDFIDEAERMIFEVAEGGFKPSFYPLKDLVKENVKVIERLYGKRQYVTGIPTGFIELDRLTSGLQSSDLIVVAGRPSMGKTAFCLNIAHYASTLPDGPIPVGIFSLEMSKEQLVTRLLSAESEIDHSKLRTGTLTAQELHRLFQAASRLLDARIFIDDTPSLSVIELRARARRLKKEHGLGLLIVDYLQLMKGRGSPERREQEISEISRFLKGLAKELKIPVVAISQLNRRVEDREDKRPRLSDLRESGAIEQDADLILFLYRDEIYNRDSMQKGIAEVIIGKQRNGPAGEHIELAFLEKVTAFRNLQRE